MSGAALLLLTMLEVKHLLFDFVFQSLYHVRNKGTYGHPGGLAHSGLHVLGTSAALALVAPRLSLAVAILAGEFVIHYHVDWGKEQIMRRRDGVHDAFFWRMMGLDQFLHQLTYVAIVAILFL
jgi:hypothetical protein